MAIRGALAAALMLVLSGPLRAQDAAPPLSAIDWLSESLTTPIAQPGPGSGSGSGSGSGPEGEAPVAGSATAPDVTVTALDTPSADGTGLLAPAVTGLPANLWAASDGADLAARIATIGTPDLPALQAQLFTLLLAEADGPRASTPGSDAFLLSRIDALLALGAVEPAQALLERAGPDSPALFRRWFDVALLTGSEQRACAALSETAGLAPSFPARIFCLAREGDWSAAALALGTGSALGFLSADDEALLSRFLDPELFEGAPPLTQPEVPTPLKFRMFEAVGEPLPTATLPRPFAVADLRDVAGWKAQLAAVERLARAGAVSENRLLGLYSARLPAASGGVWDRVEAVQRFDTALGRRDPGAVSSALPDAWEQMRRAGLGVAFARLYGERLASLPLRGTPANIAFDVGLLSPAYETVAAARSPSRPQDAFLIAVARGDLSGTAADGPLRAAIKAAFDGTAPLPAPPAPGTLGAAILSAIADLTGPEGTAPSRVARGLAALRAQGLEDTARQTALELLLLEPR